MEQRKNLKKENKEEDRDNDKRSKYGFRKSQKEVKKVILSPVSC